MKKLGDNIKKRREEMGLTQTELADKIGVTKSLICKYEKGSVANMPLAKLEQIAIALNIHPSLLLDWKVAEISPDIKAIINKDLNNDQLAEVKQFIDFVKSKK